MGWSNDDWDKGYEQGFDVAQRYPETYLRRYFVGFVEGFAQALEEKAKNLRKEYADLYEQKGC